MMAVSPLVNSDEVHNHWSWGRRAFLPLAQLFAQLAWESPMRPERATVRRALLFIMTTKA